MRIINSFYNDGFGLDLFPGGSVVKNPLANAEAAGLIPESGRSPGGRNGNPLRYSYWDNPMNRGARPATVQRVTELDTTEQPGMHINTH